MATKTYHLRGTNGAGPVGMSITFTADDGTSDSAAKAVCQSVATLFDTYMSVFKEGSEVPVAVKTPGVQGTTVSCPADVVLSDAV